MYSDLQKAAICVGTCNKYNNGENDGVWLYLSDYSDMEEFTKACFDAHSEVEEPDFFFFDFECIPDDMIGDGTLHGKFFELRDKLDYLSETDKQAFSAWMANNNYTVDSDPIDELIRCFKNSYIGEYKTQEDFAKESLTEDFLDLPLYMEIPVNVTPFGHFKLTP